MKIKYILLGIVAFILILAPLFVSGELYGDKTCEEKFPNYFVCRNNDGTLDHVFLSYEAMQSHYMPPLEETFIPETTYVYGSGTTTYSYSGN